MKFSEFAVQVEKYKALFDAHKVDPEVQPVVNFYDQAGKNWRSIGTEDLKITYSGRFDLVWLESDYSEDE